MRTTKAQRDEWLKKRGAGMTSAVGEYTPSEFWILLLDVNDLERQLAEAKVEIEAMLPLVDWARHHPQFPKQYLGAPSITRKPK